MVVNWRQREIVGVGFICIYLFIIYFVWGGVGFIKIHNPPPPPPPIWAKGECCCLFLFIQCFKSRKSFAYSRYGNDAHFPSCCLPLSLSLSFSFSSISFSLPSCLSLFPVRHSYYRGSLRCVLGRSWPRWVPGVDQIGGVDILIVSKFKLILALFDHSCAP